MSSLWLALLIVIPIVLLIASAIIGFKVANNSIKKSIKKKPYMNRNQTRAIFRAMGVQINETQILQMENSFKKALD